MSHHPDDVTVISIGSPPYIDLDDQFIQPSAEQVPTTD